MHSGIELLNSRYSGMHWDGPDLHITLSSAYIHKSGGIPGRDPGSAWSQEADLVLHDATLKAAHEAGTGDAIRAAQLELDGEAQDLVPVPPPARHRAYLVLHLAGGGKLEAQARALSVRLFGRPLFLEEV